MNWDTFKAIPDSALKDITATVNADGSQKTGDTGNTGNTGNAQEAGNINDLGKHTENSSTSAGQGQGGTNGNAGTQHQGATSAGKLLGDKGAEFAITLMNFAIPALIYLMLTKGGYETDREQWRLDKEERDTVKPVMQNVLDKIMIDLNNPYLQLGVVLAIIYGAKGAENSVKMKKNKKDIVPKQEQPLAPVVPFTTIKKRTYDEIFADEFNQAVSDYRVEKKVKPEVAVTRVKQNKSKMGTIERNAKEIFKAQE